MLTKFEIEANKTYATEANAVKAVEKVFDEFEMNNLRYFIMRTADGSRFFPVFVGQSAILAGVHHRFNVVA